MTFRPAPRLSLAALLLGATAACATSGGPEPPRSESLLTPTSPPPGRECRVSATPTALPAADVLVDSAALREDVLALLRDGTRPGYALFSVGYDRNGWNARRVLIEHDLPQAVADSLQGLVFAHRRELSPGDPFGVRLRVDLAEEPVFRVGRQEVCAALVLDGSALALGEGAWSATRATPPDLSGNRIWVRVLVDRTGRVADARVEHGPVRPGSETALLNLLHSLSFEPALVDGEPAPSWIRVPIPVRGW